MSHGIDLELREPIQPNRYWKVDQINSYYIITCSLGVQIPNLGCEKIASKSCLKQRLSFI